MRNGRFLIIGGTVSEPYHSSNFLSICFVIPCLFITFATLINKRRTQ